MKNDDAVRSLVDVESNANNNNSDISNEEIIPVGELDVEKLFWLEGIMGGQLQFWVLEQLLQPMRSLCLKIVDVYNFLDCMITFINDCFSTF